MARIHAPTRATVTVRAVPIRWLGMSMRAIVACFRVRLPHGRRIGERRMTLFRKDAEHTEVLSDHRTADQRAEIDIDAKHVSQHGRIAAVRHIVNL